MGLADQRVEVVVLSSVGLMRAFASAGLTEDQARAAVELFMPHLQAQELAEAKDSVEPASVKVPDGRSRPARKFSRAILSLLDRELDRLCDRATVEEQALGARRSTGLALLNMMKGEHLERRGELEQEAPLLLEESTRLVPPES